MVDINEYMDLFLQESREHLQSLNNELLQLEQNPRDKDALNEIFRAAHTLKGMAATMGFDKITELTHLLEDILDDLREDAFYFSPELGDLLFQCVDVLEVMVEDLAIGKEEDHDISELMGKLKDYHQRERKQNLNQEDLKEEIEKRSEEFEIDVYSKEKISDYEKFEDELVEGPELESEPEPEFRPEIEEKTEAAELEFFFSEEEEDLLVEARRQKLNVYQVHVEIDPECIMKSVRAFMVYNNLGKMGQILKSIPEIQDIESDIKEDIIIFLITSHSQEEIEISLDMISEVTIKEIKVLESPSSDLVLDEIIEDTVDINPDEDKTRKEEKKDDLRTEIRRKINKTVRVDIEKLDQLMNLVGELVINKTRLEQIFKTNNLSDLHVTVEQIDRITSDLQNLVMGVRMVPIEQVFSRFPRMVRDLSKELGKQVELIMEGKETELDRTIIDEIGDPLVHLIRNSIDHGLEDPETRQKAGKPAQGNLCLLAKQEGNSVIIIVEDDGQGINIDKIKEKALEKGMVTQSELEQMDENSIINLIFSPGFSTSNKITDISGRGVGLDVVKAKIQSLNGNVFVESKAGQGTRFTIKLPLTLAIIQALMVKVGEETFAIPLVNIDETICIKSDKIQMVQGQEVIVLRGTVLRLVRLAEVLEVPGEIVTSDELNIVVVRKDNQQISLAVNELIGQQEIVISSLGKMLNGIPGIAGAAILGDGTVSLILDISTLL